MISYYAEELNKIADMLGKFIENRKIEVQKLDTMDNLISFANKNQIKVINSGYFPIDQQMILFGTLTNVKNVLETMKQRLEVAFERHENPTTAEAALELMPSFANLEPFISDFINNKTVRDVDRLSDFSRILHRKASKLGFSKSLENQLKEANINPEDIQEFIEKLKNNIELELDVKMGDESNENTDRYVGSD